MKSGSSKRQNRRPGNQMVSYRNHERYSDPTVFLAIRNIARSESRKTKA